MGDPVFGGGGRSPEENNKWASAPSRKSSARIIFCALYEAYNQMKSPGAKVIFLDRFKFGDQRFVLAENQNANAGKYQSSKLEGCCTFKNIQCGAWGHKSKMCDCKILLGVSSLVFVFRQIITAPFSNRASFDERLEVS